MIIDKAVYLDGRRERCGDVRSELEHRRSEANGFLWVGLADPTAQEFDAIKDELRLHPLAVEDALTMHGQRAKIDFYDETMFVVLKTLRYIESSSDVETGELVMFVGERFVLTVRYGRANPLAGVRHAIEADPERLALGPLAVLHAVLDHIVDTYVAVDRELARDLEEIEEAIFADTRGRISSGDIYRLKREVLEFKRGSAPLVAPLRSITHGDKRGLFPKRLRPFYADVLDHLLQVTEHTESYDRLLSDILNAHLAQMSVQQNDDMRKISAWVAIAALPTMIAGIYGMNFDYIPELSWHYGYFVVIAVMLVACGSLYALFRRSKWL